LKIVFLAYLDMLIRPAEPDEAMAVACVHVRSWQAAYRTLLPDEYLDNLRPEDRARRYDFTTADPLKPHTIVAVEAGVIHGFATTAPSHEMDLSDHGELCGLYVHPGQWGQGIGVALVSAARAHLFKLGFRRAVLWVLARNVHAMQFYKADGWEPDGLRRTNIVWDVTVAEVRYQRGLEAP
jgi:GNAT superfamily N-acetyltransferase